MSAADELPRQVFSGPDTKVLRQGDLCFGTWHQLRATAGDPRGPGPADIASHKVPYCGDYVDHPIVVRDALFQIRLWSGWVMILEQSCEIIRNHPEDSRVQVAPVAFEQTWPGAHWDPIRLSSVPGYFYLPQVDDADRKRYGLTEAWLDSEAAVVLKSTCTVTASLLGRPCLSLSPAMRALLQAKLVDYWSVRGWTRDQALDQFVGMRIRAIQKTDEKHPGPGRLYKFALDRDDDDADEITIGVVLNH